MMKEYKMSFDLGEETGLVNDFMEATEWIDSGKMYTVSRKTCAGCGRDMPDTEFPRHRHDKLCYSCLREGPNALDTENWLRTVYDHIAGRCNNPNHSQYHHYGGRGIECKFTSVHDFRAYVKSNLKGADPGYEIHRIDNNGNYEPGNIRFVPWIVHVNIHKE